MISNELFTLKDKVIVVTGGTGILGGSFIQGIAAAGGIPIILGRNETTGEARAKEIVDAGGQAMFVKADVMNEADLHRAKDLVIEKFGTIHGLVNGAGGNMPEGVLQNDADIFH